MFLKNKIISKKFKNLDEKDMMCTARLLQSSLFENPTGIFFGCRYCSYSQECTESLKSNGKMHSDTLRIKLQEITGVDLSYIYNPDNLEAKFK